MKEGPGELIDSFSDKIIPIATNILQQGFGLTLVGGSVRDFFRDGKTGSDLDFELTYREKLESEDWKLKIDNLIQLIARKLSCKVEKLPFLIVKITGLDFSMELAPPRLEFYEGKDMYGHSDFTCRILSQMDCRKSFLRRDITVNSIGVEFQLANPLKTILRDPFDGLPDLQKKIIRTVNPDFYKDPVRFLRIVRFSLNLDMKFDPELEKNLHCFNLSMLTAHHFFKEAFKCDFFLFTDNFFTLTDKHAIPLSRQLAGLSFLKESSLQQYIPKNKKEILALLLFNETKGFDRDELIRFVRYSGTKESYLKHLVHCKSILNDLEAFSPDKLKEKIKNCPVEEVLKEDILQAGLKFYSFFKKDLICDDILEKGLPQKKIETWKTWRKCIPKNLKGEKLFIKLGQSLKIKPKNKSYLRLYAHLKKIWD